MDYSYLNQSFDPTCTLTGPMDPTACQLACSGYPDPLGGSGCSGQLGPPGYSRYGPSHGPGVSSAMSSMRSANVGIGHAATNGASMLSAAAAAGRMNAANAAAARAHADMQNSMFQTGIGLQSKC